MKYLVEIAKAIGTKAGDLQKITRDKKAEIEAEVNKISDKDVDEIVTNLFPSGIPVSTDFYNTLQKYEFNIGYGSASHTLGGRLWAKAYSEIEKEKQRTLLDSLFEKKGRGVWRAIFFLPEFCSRIEIDSKFAAGWFIRFGKAVKDDMANLDFFNGVKNYALHFPDSGMKVFETYINEQLDFLRIYLSADILGTIRSQADKGQYKKDMIDDWDQQLRTSSQINMRLIYYRSLPTSFNLGNLSAHEIDKELTLMLKGEPDEVSEAFSIVWRCLRSQRADNEFVKYAMSWFSQNVSSKLPDAAKYHLVNAMWFFRTPGKHKVNIDASESDNLLIAIQPIPENNRGTWEYFEMYLVERLHQDKASFGDILGRFVEANPDGMLNKFQDDTFDHLQSEICQTKEQNFLQNWLISIDEDRRAIARAIFQKSESMFLSKNDIPTATEEQLKAALYEFIRKPMLAEKTSEYLLFLEPAFRHVKPELQKEFKDEMTLQAVNFPGACLERWEKIENPSDLLKSVIANAEKYFESFKNIKDSPAISFTFPGCKEAAEKEANVFSNKISKGAREKSIFAQLAKNIQIIYGSRWSVMADGKLGQETNFSEFSHSMEYPRVEIIDPEGMAIKRVQTRMQME